MAITLRRLIPAHNKTITALWCKKEFMRMSQTYRDVRSRSRNPMDSCYWCKHKFDDGEMMALACFNTRGNKTLCQHCADVLLASESSNAPAHEADK